MQWLVIKIKGLWYSPMNYEHSHPTNQPEPLVLTLQHDKKTTNHATYGGEEEQYLQIDSVPEFKRHQGHTHRFCSGLHVCTAMDNPPRVNSQIS